MNIAITILALVMVVTGIYFSQNKAEKLGDETPQNQKVLSEETTKEEVPEVTENKSIPTSIPNTPTNTAPALLEKTSMNEYRYPNSTVINSSSNTLLLNSNDNPEIITQWYKDKIKNEGMSVTSFITTKTNDNVLNKLVGANGSKDVSVDISKNSESNIASISIKLN